ncbi:hypothetical protein [Mucilaginibacter sp.]
MNMKTTALQAKINQALALEKLTLWDIEDFNKLEREQLGVAITKTLAGLKDEERDRFLEKIDGILPAGTKHNMWEVNHQAIGSAISKHMRLYGVMPTKSAIAEQTNLSRQTITKHFKEYKAHPEFAAEAEQFKFMSNRILASVFKFASDGDMKAARLYFEMTGAITKQPAGTVVNKQNSYIQINNTILSQENLKQLSPEQLNQIESIVNSYEHQLVS